MQITIDIPDALQISEADLRAKLAISLFQQERIIHGMKAGSLKERGIEKMR